MNWVSGAPLTACDATVSFAASTWKSIELEKHVFEFARYKFRISRLTLRSRRLSTVTEALALLST